MKPTYRKSWAGNLLIWSDLTLSPSFKSLQMHEDMGLKFIISSGLGYVCNILVFLQLYALTSEVAALKSCQGISLKCSR